MYESQPIQRNNLPERGKIYPMHAKHQLFIQKISFYTYKFVKIYL